jgi:hypothetical protein
MPALRPDVLTTLHRLAPGRDRMDALVQQIARLQSKGDDGYSEGLFPSQRCYRYLPYEVEDDGLFMTAVVIYALQQVRDALSADGRALVDAMTQRAVANYPKYLGNEGVPLYNYWQNHPTERYFPNGALFSHFRHFRLPEDIDTTAYAYLTAPHPREDARWLQQERLPFHANRTHATIQNTLPRYRHLRAYSTWLGAPSMPLDFDVCVLTNLMLVVFDHDLPLNRHDLATLTFIAAVIESGDYQTAPFRVAPWYPRPSLILYHVARLVGTYEVPYLHTLRDDLVRCIRRQLDGAFLFMERVILATSLMRLGAPHAIDWLPASLDDEVDRFFFFTASLLTALDNRVTWALAQYPVFHLHYRCRAHSLALLLEHEAWRQRRS